MESYKNLNNRIKKNYTKTTLYLIPLLNILIEYCKPYKEIIVKLNFISHAAFRDPHELYITVQYKNSIIKIECEKTNKEKDINGSFYISDQFGYKYKISILQKNKPNEIKNINIEFLKNNIDTYKEILYLINKEFIFKIVQKVLIDFRLSPERIIQHLNHNTLQRFGIQTPNM